MPSLTPYTTKLVNSRQRIGAINAKLVRVDKRLESVSSGGEEVEVEVEGCMDGEAHCVVVGVCLVAGGGGGDVDGVIDPCHGAQT